MEAIATTTTRPPVKLNELAPSRTTIKCLTACGTYSRVYRTEPSAAIGQFRYCPLCGSDNVFVYRSSDTDQWEAMSRDYELPIEVMKQLYDLWVPTQYHRFSDFVADFRAGKTEGEPNHGASTLPAPKPTPPMPRLKVPV